MVVRWLAYGLLVLGLVFPGCHCGGKKALTVDATAPLDNQIEVPIETTIAVELSEEIDPVTLTNESFTLEDATGARVSGTVTIGEVPDVAVFTPDEPLALLTAFTATVTTAVMSIRGRTLDEDFQWTFTTLDSAWGVSETIENIGTGNARRHQLGIDPEGNTFAVWEQATGNRTDIWSNRYTRRDQWGEPELIETNDDGSATRPQIAVDPAGNAFAVWEQADGDETFIWANRYVVGEGWGDAQPLQTGEITNARNPSVAADPAGNAIAVWIQRDLFSTGELAWASRYVVGDTWGPSEPIDPVAPSLAGIVTEVGMDEDGNAIAIWTRPRLVGKNIWANRYVVDPEDPLEPGWEGAVIINDDDESSTTDPRLAVDPMGNAFVVWTQPDGEREDIWTNRYEAEVGWGPQELLEDNETADAKEPDITTDASGFAYAVWTQADEFFDNIYVSTYTPGAEPGSEWGTPVLIEEAFDDPLDDGDAAKPRIAVNAAGFVFVVWEQPWLDWLSIWSNRFEPGEGWDTAELIEQIERAGKSPQIAVDENDRAQALWLHSNDRELDTVRTNRYE